MTEEACSCQSGGECDCNGDEVCCGSNCGCSEPIDPNVAAENLLDEAHGCDVDDLLLFVTSAIQFAKDNPTKSAQAIAASAVAAGWATLKSSSGGRISGDHLQQAQWEFVRNFTFNGATIRNSPYFRIINYAELLQPTFETSQKTIPPAMMDWLQVRAKELLANNLPENVSPEQYVHWELIASGTPPFGYKVS